jgi:hypothetical protein
MDASHCVFDFSALKQAEHAYRTTLNKHPDNLDMRIRLAWCLFMQALYQSGQETILKNIAMCGATAETIGVFDAGQLLLDRDAQTLLQECLHQTFTVIHLSSRSEDRLDGEKIQALAALSGAEEAVAQSREKAARVLNEMVEEVMCIPAPPQDKA